MENDRYTYWPLPERPPLRWPDGARLAVWVSPNIEHFPFDKPRSGGGVSGPLPDVPSYAARDYGNRVGVWRMMDVLDKHEMPVTVALNADVCRYEPQIITAGVERGWEWMGHGMTNAQRLTGLDEAAERSVIQQVMKTITVATGAPPRGWLGPGLQETFNTPDLLAEAGITYVADWPADEQPFPMRVKRGRLISVPYSRGVSDISAFNDRNWTAEQFYQMICDEFDTLYADGERSGRVMALVIHPYLIGHPYRSKWLDKALAYIRSHDRVWLATGGAIADWYYEHYHDHAARRTIDAEAGV